MKQRCVFPCRINIFTNLKYHFNEANIFQLKDWIDFILQPLFVRLQWGREVKKNILECNETNIYCVIERFLLLALLKVFKAYAHWFWSCFQPVYVDSTRKMWRDGWLGTENLCWLGTEKLERMVDSARKIWRDGWLGTIRVKDNSEITNCSLGCPTPPYPYPIHLSCWLGTEKPNTLHLLVLSPWRLSLIHISEPTRPY